MDIPVRPLQWVGPATKTRQRSPFDSTWSSTLTVLDHELRMLHARYPVLQVDVTESDIRRDGQIRATARPSSPAVRLLFDTDDGPMALGCDRFADWQSNVRAIALGLEALRRVDRYGISQGGEQYKGYLQLDAPAIPSTTAQAAQIIAQVAGVSVEQVWASPQRAYRLARAAVHPDRFGGDRLKWDQVVEAGCTLGLAD